MRIPGTEYDGLSEILDRWKPVLNTHINIYDKNIEELEDVILSDVDSLLTEAFEQGREIGREEREYENWEEW